jgi:hypothetical protein
LNIGCEKHPLRYLMDFEKLWTLITQNKQLLMCSQLLEGFKCESQIKNNGRTRNRGTLPGSQHFEGVEGRVGAPGWD